MLRLLLLLLLLLVAIILLCYFCGGGHHVRWWQYNRYVVIFTLLALTHTLRMITTDRHALITYFYFITLH